MPEATKKIVERSRYLSEAISKGIINYSSLARYIKPELEQMLLKKISTASVIMALNRLESSFQPKFRQSNIFKTPPEITVRSNLIFAALPNNEIQGLSVLISRDANSRSFFLKNQGVHESSLILSQDLFEKYKTAIEDKNPLILEDKVSAITIYLPDEALKTSGIYYFFLKSLAWEGINILELISTPSELSIVVDNQDTERTFAIIKSLFTS
ncbi:MAG: hypothetical protein HY427_03280 [Candidatus Levybacteria bacterium]|nr:hypothetical protein [Candidatus Levybacteria bacterium]